MMMIGQFLAFLLALYKKAILVQMTRTGSTADLPHFASSKTQNSSLFNISEIDGGLQLIAPINYN